MNELIFINFLLTCMFGLYLINKFFAKNGIYIWIAVMTSLSLILSVRTGNILGFTSNINIPIHISIFIACYILIEKYNEKNAKKIFNITLLSSLITLIYLIISSLYIPTINDIISYKFKTVYLENFRILIGYITSLLLAEIISIKIYKIFKKEYNSIFINATLIIILVGILDGIVLSLISYVGIIDNMTIARLIMSNYILKLGTTIIFVPELYRISKMKKVKKND